MRSFNDIKKSLIASLETQESGAWAQISQSLVGKELIAFGAEVIAASDNVVDTLVQSFDYNTADERALISLSHVHNIPLSFNSPAYIRVRLNNKVGLSFKPFDLVYTVGNVKFTNVSYFNGNDDIVLYQGQVKSMRTGTDITDFSYDKLESWNNISIPVDSEKIMKCHNIGKAFPDSVYVFYIDETSQGNMSMYTPLRSGPSIACYKQYCLMNKDLVIVEGDGVWGKSDFRTPSYQIIWLELTEGNFALNGTLTSKVHGKLGFRVMGSGNAMFDSMEFARSYFRKFYLEMNSIVSKEQITQFVNSFPYVNDCSVVANNGVIYVYVKPTDPVDKGEYGGIQAELDLKGGILTSHEVAKGTSLKFQFQLDSIIKTSMRSQIESFLKERYGYLNIGFSEVLNCTEVSTLLYSRFGVSTRVVFAVEGASVTSGGKFQFLPINNSIKILNADNKVVGYDLNGQLFAEQTQGRGVYKVSSPVNKRVGKYVMDDNTSYLKGFDRGYIRMCPSNVITSLLGGDSVSAITHNGYVYIFRNDVVSSNFTVYSTEQINPQGLISNIIPISGVVPKRMQNLNEKEDIPIYVNGAFYCLEFNKDNNEIQLQFFTGTGYAPYYTLSIPQSLQSILGVYVSGSTLYIVCEDNNVVVISHFNTSHIGWSIVKLEVPKAVKGKKLYGFHCYKDGYCSMVFGTKEVGSNVIKEVSIGRCSSLSVTDSSITVMNFEKIYDSDLELDVNTVYVYGTDEYVWYGDGSENKLSEIVYDDGEVFAQDNKVREYPLYYLTSSNTIGTVNYLDGTIVFEGTSGTSFSYESSMVNLDEKTYLRLDETTPVVWN